VRAGSFALSLFSTPLNVHVLRALENEPRPLVDLRRAAGSPPQTTTRGHLRSLTEHGILSRRQQKEFPGAVEYELGPGGAELLQVARILEGWLAEAPEEPVTLGSTAAKSVLKSLVAGWDSMIIRALAARPLSLTELSKLIPGLNYPSLERRLGGLRMAGLVKAQTGEGRSTPYAATEWLRQAAGPIAAAARWEREQAPAGNGALGRLDVEAIFLLAVPLLSLSKAVSSSFRLGVEVRSSSGEAALAGVQAQLEQGAVSGCTTRLGGKVGASAAGPAPVWLRALSDGEMAGLELSGDCGLAKEIVDGLHTALCRATAQRA
jgi:DNA-binding HxlR family transcriptional regulator